MIRNPMVRGLEFLIRGIPDFRGKVRLCSAVGALITGYPIRTPYGPRIECHLNDNTNKAAVFGWYDDVVFNVVRQLPLGSVFVDIGANSGLFSIIAAQTVGRDGLVYAFEPQSAMFDILESNLRINGIGNVIAINKALSAETAELGMTDWNPRHSGTAHVDPNGSRRIQAINLDDAMPELVAMVNNRPLAIKIDVEGAESDVLAGISTILECAHTVVIEIDDEKLRGFGSSSRDVYRTMEKYGFEPRIASEAKHYDEVFARSGTPPL